MSYLVTELIRKKRDGKALEKNEMQFLVEGFSRGTIPDYQITAWLMASYLKGMTSEETVALTTFIKNSGRSFQWRELSPSLKSAVFVDKHSTGGVGDKVSLIVAPIAAAMGMKIPMMSGRSLGHTGGTVDKLESIPGFSMYPSTPQMVACLEDVGTVMMAQADDLCPADKKLYALRDVSATIENIPLITASIVSKKWAEGVDAILFDVKCGNAAFMETHAQAKALAQSLVRVATLAGMKAVALVTRMEEPLGAFVGNAVEVKESLMILSNQYKNEKQKSIIKPLVDLCVEQVVQLALLSGFLNNRKQAEEQARATLLNGKALELFNKMATAQGAIDHWKQKLPKAELTFLVKSNQRGYLHGIDSKKLALLGFDIGMGRQKSSDKIDPTTGYEILCQVGDSVEPGTPLLEAHLHTAEQFHSLENNLRDAFTVKGAAPDSSIIQNTQQLVIEEVRP